MDTILRELKEGSTLEWNNDADLITAHRLKNHSGQMINLIMLNAVAVHSSKTNKSFEKKLISLLDARGIDLNSWNKD